MACREYFCHSFLPKWTTRRCFGFCRESISWQIPHRDQLQKAERRRIRNDWTKHAASSVNASSNSAEAGSDKDASQRIDQQANSLIAGRVRGRGRSIAESLRGSRRGEGEESDETCSQSRECLEQFRRNTCNFRTSLLPTWSNLSVFFIMQGEVGEVPANGRKAVPTNMHRFGSLA